MDPSPDKKLDLVLLWHMHQPEFRDPETGIFALPWVYLHAIKDYADMAWHLEHHPQVHAVVNLVPVLLDQIEDYAAQFATGEIRDPLLKLLVHEDLHSITLEERELILDRCFRGNHVKMIEPFAPYKRLFDVYTFVRDSGPDPGRYLSAEYLGELLTWYHLAWTGETVRREHELVPRLVAKGQGFTFEDRHALFLLIGRLIGELIARYRRLAQSGQVELSTTPHFHPIGPLLLDLRVARQAQPDLPLPAFDQYPGGRARLGWHIQHAIESHTLRFGMAPRGMWPAEGAISSDFLRTLADSGVQWAASGESVLAHSVKHALNKLPERECYLYRAHRIGKEQPITCFFRDDHLSDLIGFEYSNWHGRDAVAHFMSELDRIRTGAADGETPLVSVMLDGENAWEFYPYNGYYFLDELYEAIEQHADIRTVTPSGYVDQLATATDSERTQMASELPGVVAGSWVYGNLATWIGSADKNLAWNLLCGAKQSFDMVMASGRLSVQEKAIAEERLAACEGSDWFWWFGDYNPQDAVTSFDQLFREKLIALYRTLHLPVPDHLNHPISHGGGHAELGGAMRRAS